MSRLLYIIKHKTEDIFKIGIATDNSRFQQLNNYYDIDWESSIYFEGLNDDVVKMEKILHRGFYKYNIIKEGTGGTEWFKTKCLSDVIDTILIQIPLFKFKINLEYKSIDLDKVEYKKQIFDNVIVGWFPAFAKDLTKESIGYFEGYNSMSLNKRNTLKKLIEKFKEYSTETLLKNEKYRYFLLENRGIETSGGNDVLYYEKDDLNKGLWTNHIIGLNNDRFSKNHTKFIMESLCMEFECNNFIIDAKSMQVLGLDVKVLKKDYILYTYYKHDWDCDLNVYYLAKKETYDKLYVSCYRSQTFC